MHSSRCAIIYLFVLSFFARAGLGARRVGLRVQTLLLATYVASNDCVHVRARYFTVYLKKYIMIVFFCVHIMHTGTSSAYVCILARVVVIRSYIIYVATVAYNIHTSRSYSIIRS